MCGAAFSVSLPANLGAVSVPLEAAERHSPLVSSLLTWRAARGQAPGAAVPVLFFSSASSTQWPLSGEGGQIIRRKDEREFRALPWGRRAVVSSVQMYSWASLVAQMIKNPPAMQET